jgi:uncharacterized protein YndB with AHSA1/START domain
MFEDDVLTALAEPGRRRIVELLDAAPRAVGEIAAALGMRQPQATKHLQALERAGLVTVHPLGRRRIYALRRRPLHELRLWLEQLGDDHPSEAVLDEYQQAIAEERGHERTVHLTRTVAAGREAVWRAWTDAAALRRWWHPEHFTVAECVADPVPGGRLMLVLREGDGRRHRASGHYLALQRPRRLVFELAPVGPGGVHLFHATHRVELAARGERTRVTLAVDVSGVGRGAEPALAGLEIGWRQLLDNLARELS